MILSFRPQCINHGCTKPVAVMDGKVTDDNPRWRVHCGHCQKASYGFHAHAAGVTPYKTGRCSNTDSQLGFPCLINWDLTTDEYTVSTQVDHKNGNPADNRPENLQELCPICHTEKGKRAGDFNRWRNYIG